MRSIILVATIAATVSCLSCKKENINDNGVPTIIKGHVEDPTRGISISGYKIVLSKDNGIPTFGTQGPRFEKVAETYTDNNGNYSMNFNMSESGRYGLEEQYYGNPYYHESTSGTGLIVAGATNIINMTAWKPVELKLNVQVINNHTPPLNIRNELAATNERLLNVESIYQQNITAICSLRTRPNSDINIIFYYTVNLASPTPTTHQKIIPYRSTFDSSVTLNYVIDCLHFKT